MDIDPDILAMDEDQLRKFLMKQRKWTRVAVREKDNKSCWVAFLVICSEFLPPDERWPLTKKIMGVSKEEFLSNCEKWHEFAVRQGKAIKEVIQDLNNPE